MTVLEAQDRVGGRVCTKKGGTLDCAVDLGASIITGTAADIAKGLQPDPSAVIARSGRSIRSSGSVTRLSIRPDAH